MFNVRLAGTWLSLVVSFMASFVLSFFPLDVLDEIWDLIESVSEGFLTYSLTQTPVTYIDVLLTRRKRLHCLWPQCCFVSNIAECIFV